MQEAQLRHQINKRYGVILDEVLTKDQIQDWLREQEERSTFPNAKIRGAPPKIITPRPEKNLELIKSEPILMFPSSDRPRFIKRDMALTNKLPEIGGDVPPIDILRTEEEDFTPNIFNANAKDLLIEPDALATAPAPITTEEDVAEPVNGSEEEEEKIDAFDFETHEEDFDLFEQYFKGVELYLRTAIWNIYKYEYLIDDEERDDLDSELAESEDEKGFLENLTNVFEPRDLLMRWYIHYNPTNATDEFVDRTIEKYTNWEDVLFKRLYRKYVDPDFPEMTKLWFSPKRTGDIPEQEEEEIDELERIRAKTLSRQGTLEQIQDDALTARRINVQATFQPKTVLLPPPDAPRTRAVVVTAQTTPATGVAQTRPQTTQRTFEMSRPGQRITQEAPPKQPIPETTTEIDPAKALPKLDLEKLHTGKGSYTVEQLRVFLGQLGLPKTGNKPDLIDRLQQALGFE